MSYREKYLKYKKKYYILKNQYGGQWLIDETMMAIEHDAQLELNHAIETYDFTHNFTCTDEKCTTFDIKYENNSWKIKLKKSPDADYKTVRIYLLENKLINTNVATNEMRIIYDDDHPYMIYEGNVNSNNMPHGKGKLLFKIGILYKGDFNDGKIEGIGLRTFNSESYQGEFKDNNMEGTGIYTYQNGGIYQGEFKDDKKEGTGIYTYQNGDVYQGEFKDNKMEGIGLYTYKKGDIYQGEFKDNNMEGNGLYTYKDGELYQGEFKNNKKHGRGKIIDKYGYSYEGEFLDNVVKIKIEKSMGPFSKRDLTNIELVIFIGGHGCDTEQPLNIEFPINLPVEHADTVLNATYVSNAEPFCEHIGSIQSDLMNAYIFFNNGSPINEQIVQYKEMKRRVPIFEEPQLDHKYFFYDKKETYRDFNYTSTDGIYYDNLSGIYIIKNNLGLPNNVNLFDWNYKDIQNQVYPIYCNRNYTIFHEQLSKILSKKLRIEDGYNMLLLSDILQAFYDFINPTIRVIMKKMKLVIVDNSCRTICD